MNRNSTTPKPQHPRYLREFMFNSLFVAVLLLGLGLGLGLSSNCYAENPRTQNQKSWISDLSEAENTKVSDVTSQLKPLLAAPKIFERNPRSYSRLSFYYKRALRAFTALYPKSLFPETSIEAGLSEYKGKLSLTSYDVFFIPFAPIVPEASLNLNDLRFFKTATIVDGDTIHGFTIESSLPSNSPPIARNVNVIHRLTMAYIATVNAKVLGFSHAQLIPELSRGITSADRFEYNGLRPWSEHSRYKQNDQLEQPIRLTNYAHQAGSQFNISSHPDFALSARFVGEEAVRMTFFLWRAKTKVLGFDIPVQPSGPPDFVFRIDLKRSTAK